MNEPWLNIPSAERLDILAAIARYIARKGHGPALHELAEAVGVQAISAAQRHVQLLARQGMVTFEREGVRQRMMSRTLRLTERGEQTLRRYELLRGSSLLRAERELVLDAHSMAMAERVGLPLTAFHRRQEGDKTILRFVDRRERDYWAAILLEALCRDPPKSET